MRLAGLVALGFLAAAAANGEMPKRRDHPYRQEYKKRTYGKTALAGVAASGALRAGKRGNFGHEIGSALGAHVVKNTVEYTVAGLRHEDLHYYRSNKKGFGPRLEHALASTVVTRKTTTGRHTAASGRMSGAMAGGMATAAMSPAGFSVAGGAATGGITLGAEAGANVAREFWPRGHKRKKRHRKT